jgi:ribosomal-protein-alanine N-acetyltransferase
VVIQRYRPEWRQELVALRESRGIARHGRLLEALESGESLLWLARAEPSAPPLGYVQVSPWKNRPDTLSLSVLARPAAEEAATAGSTAAAAQPAADAAATGPASGTASPAPDPQPNDDAHWCEVTLALVEAVRAESAADPALLAGAPAPSRMIAFSIQPAWLGRFAGCGWTPMLQIVHYRKSDRHIPPAATTPPAAPVTFRAFAPADLDAVMKVECAAFPELWWNDEETFRMWSAAPDSTFDVMLVGERVVGYNINTSTPPRGYVVRIGIDPVYQGRGLGRRLLAHALETLFAAGCEYVELSTQEENDVSRGLYEKFGFAVTGGHWMVQAPVAVSAHSSTPEC